ncbi:MAG: hypothetical protein RID15_04000 [Marinovum algicola]|uniref:hypothetical protein n=1 Tax=Marinovum TaxID=367771 RepID=UPI00111461E2|nr:hypothetical protein [Marinovum algicola]
MFSPEGFFPFASSLPWIHDRADDFYRNCALPWATKEKTESNVSGERRLYRAASAGRMLYTAWLIDVILAYQPKPVFLSSPNGRVMRAAPAFFQGNDNLSIYDFEWPLSDDELRPIIEYKKPEEALSARFDYYFLDQFSWCITLPEEERCSQLYPLGKDF